MRKLVAGSRLVVASHNKGKVWEINELIRPYGLDAVSAGDLGLAEPDETEPTFEGNARLKALAAARGSGLPALADDSGLEVDCLGGAPGIYSARWAGPSKDFGLAMRKVAEEITARHGWVAPGPRANFVSVLCLAWPDGAAETFEGKVFGHLLWPPRGGNGFGYDPMFLADGHRETFGEMEPAGKYAISHRTRAFAAFKARCLDAIAPAPGVAPGADLSAGAGVSPLDARRALEAAAASLSTMAELAVFVVRLRDDLAMHAADWREATLADYLERLARNLLTAPAGSEPAPRAVAKALLAASGRVDDRHRPS